MGQRTATVANWPHVLPIGILKLIEGYIVKLVEFLLTEEGIHGGEGLILLKFDWMVILLGLGLRLLVPNLVVRGLTDFNRRARVQILKNCMLEN